MNITTMRGQRLNMMTLAMANQHKPAVGNAGMNARGDRIERGIVVRTREQVMTEYNASNPKAVRQGGLNNILSEVLTPSEAIAQSRKVDAIVIPEHGSDRQAHAPKRKISDSET